MPVYYSRFKQCFSLIAVVIFDLISNFLLFQIFFDLDKPLDFTSLYKNLFDEPLNLGLILTVMMSYSILFFIIAWYVEHVMPGNIL